MRWADCGHLTCKRFHLWTRPLFLVLASIPVPEDQHFPQQE